MRLATVNVTEEGRRSIMNVLSPSGTNKVAKTCYASSARQMAPTSLSIKVPGTPSCNVCMGQRFAGIAPTDTASLAKLRVAAMTLGNSFTGKLMKIVRDENGLTYGIGARVVSNGSFPSLVVNATFNKDVLQRGREMTMGLLSDFCNGKFSSDEISVAKESLKHQRDTYGCSSGFLNKMAQKAMLDPVPLNFAEYWRNIEECSHEDIQQLVRKSLKPNGFSVAAAGTLS